MADLMEIDLGDLPVGDYRAVKASVRSQAVLALITLHDSGGREFFSRFDIGKKCFIDHENAQVPLQIDRASEDQLRTLAGKIADFLKNSQEYKRQPGPANISLIPL